MTEIMRTEFVLRHEDGSVIEYFDDQEAAESAGRACDDPCWIERVDEFYPEKEPVWFSHKSMIEEDR